MRRSKVLGAARLGAVLLILLAMASFVRVSGVSAQDNSITIDMNELNDSGVSGTTTLTDKGDGTTTVSILVDGATGGHPAHIHSGTCDNLDPNPAYPLNAIDADGVSETNVPISLADLLAAPYAVNVHLSATNLGTYVTCGDIVAAVADGGDDTGTGGEVTTTPATGVGTTSSPSTNLVFVAGLAVVGLTLLASGYVLRRRDNEA